MEVREFLPGEPVFGDIVLCVDEDFTAQTRAHGRELPRNGHLYMVRATSAEVHRHWGFQDVIRLDGQETDGSFSRNLQGWFYSSRFKATHAPHVDWSKDPCAKEIEDEFADSDPCAKTRRHLWQARQCIAWRELCYSNLGLALALAVLHPWASDDVACSQDNLATAARLRRLEICRILGFPPTSPVLRLLSRLHASWGQALESVWLEGLLTALRQLLNYEPQTADLLLRHEAISRSQVRRLAFGPSEFSPSEIFLNKPELQRGAWFFRLPMARRHWLTAEVLAIQNREASAPGLALLPRRRRIGGFQREKDAVAYLLRRQRLLDHLGSTVRDVLGRNGSLPWPEPPLPGSDLIQPITSNTELVEEGKQLRHCIADYADHIAVGVYYAYRMTGPTRSTIGLKWNGHQWALDQLRGGANSSIEEEQAKKVHAWIGSHPEHSSVLRSELAKEVCRIIRLPKRPRPHHVATTRQGEFGFA